MTYVRMCLFVCCVRLHVSVCMSVSRCSVRAFVRACGERRACLHACVHCGVGRRRRGRVVGGGAPARGGGENLEIRS